jgi:hypothetical protein
MRKGNSDDFDDDADLGSFDGIPFITENMAEDLARYIADQWREREEDKLINIDVTLRAALNRTPVMWLNAACSVLHVSLREFPKKDRKAKIEALLNCLIHSESLAENVRDMPPHTRAALRRVLDNGGWIRLNTLVKDFGEMDGDGWYWDENPPKSIIGELRRRALLFIGKSAINREGKSNKKLFKVAVVPKELRELLQRILGEASVRKEEDNAITRLYATPDDLLGDALLAMRSHYEGIDWQPLVTQTVAESFLRKSASEDFDPNLVWYSLEVFCNYLDYNTHEIRTLEDLQGYHISEYASDYVDYTYLQRWSLEDRRQLIETVRRFHRFVFERGEVSTESNEEIDRACSFLQSGKRRLNLIRRPPPLGGELILTRLNPNTGAEENYTFNHQRLLMVWFDEFNQDWRTMMQHSADVPDGKEKLALIQDLISLEPAVCEILVSRADDDDFDAAIRWFYEENVITLSAW